MFEKEAEEFKKQIQQEYLDLEKNGAYPPLWERIGELWGKGAEFGYNKANEWHYNGIPYDNKPYLCKVEQPTKYDESEYEILFFDEKDVSWFRWLTLWSGEKGNETARINRKVIAWKEIVLPEEKVEDEKEAK